MSLATRADHLSEKLQSMLGRFEKHTACRRCENLNSRATDKDLPLLFHSQPLQTLRAPSDREIHSGLGRQNIFEIIELFSKPASPLFHPNLRSEADLRTLDPMTP